MKKERVRMYTEYEGLVSVLSADVAVHTETATLVLLEISLYCIKYSSANIIPYHYQCVAKMAIIYVHWSQKYL